MSNDKPPLAMYQFPFLVQCLENPMPRIQMWATYHLAHFLEGRSTFVCWETAGFFHCRSPRIGSVFGRATSDGKFNISFVTNLLSK